MENADKVLHKDLVLSLRCLARFFWHYPVVIFHTNSTTALELNWMRSVIPGQLQVDFEEVSLDFPASLLESPGGPDAFLRPPSCMLDGHHQWSLQRSCGCRCPAWRPQCWPLNWMHATHFFTAGMFRTKTFQDGGYDYFLRLDIDLFFVEEPILDPFQHMADHGCVMVYDRLSREAPGCFDDFDHRCQEYLDRMEYFGQPDVDILQVGHGPAAAGGQWTIGDVRLFTSPRYLHFADHFASGIYSHRWADQLILLRGAALFGPRANLQPESEVPAVSLCLASLFRQGAEGGVGGAPPGLVHLKGGFRQDWLLETCAAEDAFLKKFFARKL
ncbi:SEC63, partial [Symbiodinium natans]